MKLKTQTILTIILILWAVLFQPIPPAPKAAPAPERIVYTGEVLQGRTILVNQGNYTWMLEV